MNGNEEYINRRGFTQLLKMSNSNVFAFSFSRNNNTFYDWELPENIEVTE